MSDAIGCKRTVNLSFEIIADLENDFISCEYLKKLFLFVVFTIGDSRPNIGECLDWQSLLKKYLIFAYYARLRRARVWDRYLARVKLEQL